jgi:D-glycero-D-manno-heptose 1,7-bisphosphate phosphatase
MTAAARRFVFLDRDGVLNRRSSVKRYVTTPEELELLPGTREGLSLLSAHGYGIVIVTNQQGVALGRLSSEALGAVHDELRRQVFGVATFLDILVCPHSEDEACPCRKPRPGMLLEAARRHAIPLAQTFFVGDNRTDVAAGHAAGTRTIYVGEPAALAGQTPDFLAEDLIAAAKIILRENGLTEGTP